MNWPKRCGSGWRISSFAEKDMTLPEVVVEELKERGLTLAVAESCSGGGLGNQITNVPGSSEVFLGGVIAYANSVKTGILGVGEATLKKHGAVSAADRGGDGRRGAAVVRGRYRPGRHRHRRPGGGSQGKPVGLVYMHLSAENYEQGKPPDLLRQPRDRQVAQRVSRPEPGT